MTGPEHYRAGVRRLAGRPVTDEEREQGVAFDRWPPSEMDLREATAHLLAALVAVLAQTHQPDSVSWQQALEPTRLVQYDEGDPS